ncbi:TetR family transcriptional regulator [Nocardia brasiliensis]|uniref:TetR family transcriptional regulator n=1 Tax=Nocardia brasiliensis TaxID=37326 RepID=A0A6G9XRH5_NOCBR|nr:TetR/AcrR family transcriptional regulator [Nocardia brasiliensis]QIS03524.1 TetR family transcriptional regulator [Nocardia brasiliensis]
MVARIVDAGQQVLIRHGYDGASTNRIAAAAGVSPGSLYQYFPDKDAIVTAVIDRFNTEVATVVHGAVLANLGRPPETAIPTAISVLLDALGEHPALLRAVIEQTPRLSGADTVFAFEQQIGGIARAALAMHSAALPDDVDFDAASWLLVRTVEHLTIRYVLDQPPISRERFLADITRLMLNFFNPAPSRSPAQRPASRRSRAERE